MSFFISTCCKVKRLLYRYTISNNNKFLIIDDRAVVSYELNNYCMTIVINPLNIIHNFIKPFNIAYNAS